MQDRLPLLSLEETKNKARKVKNEIKNFFLNTLNINLEKTNSSDLFLLFFFKKFILATGIFFALLFLISIVIMLIFPLTPVVQLVILITFGILAGISLLGFGIFSTQYNDAINNNKKVDIFLRNSRAYLNPLLKNKNHKQTFKSLLDKVLKSRWDQAESVIAQGPLVEIKSTKPDLTTAICSRIFFDRKNDFPMVTTVLTKLFKEFGDYQKAPIMVPLIYLAALASVGKHRRGFSQKTNRFRPKQQLTTILVTDYEIKLFFPDFLDFNSTDTGGFYDNQNGIFISLEHDRLNKLKGQNSEKIIYMFFHEVAHFVAEEVMENDSKPYQKQDTKIQQNYLEIVSRIKKASLAWKLPDIADNEFENKETYWEAVTIEGFRTIFNNYQESKHASELLVTVPQTIALLGYEKGYRWLKENVPDLLQFYEEHFNTACINYLKKQRVWEHVEVDSRFLKILGLNSDAHEEVPIYQGVFNANSIQNEPTLFNTNGNTHEHLCF